MFRRRLDYLAIPGGSKGELKKERMERAIKELNGREVDRIIFLKGRDSEEDILYLGNIVQKGERVGIDTFPLHYKEYKELIKKAKRDGKFPSGVKVENVETPQEFRLWIYGILGLSEEKIKNRELNFIKDRDDKVWRKIKKVIHKLFRL
jgi:hypothetical protein